MNLSQMINETAKKQGSKIALIWEDDSYTFTEINQQITAYAAMLIELGIRPGDRVALQLEKCREFVFLHLANLAVGGVTLPLNSDYKTEEVEYFLSDSNSKLFVSDRGRYQKHHPVLDDLRIKTVVIDGTSCGSAISLPIFLKSIKPIERCTYPSQDDELAMICYTSGTTGLSKGAMISHRNLIVNMLDLQQIWRWTEEDILLHVLPLFHIHGLAVALHGSLYAGSTTVIHEIFDPAHTWEAITQEHCTMLMGVPTIYQRLMNEWEKMPSTPDLSSIRLFISGSAPLSTKLFNNFYHTTGFRILERYGMTETGMNTSNPYEPEDRKAGSVGFSLPNVKLRIANAEGSDVRPGEVGEVLLRGDNVFQGYRSMPDKTSESFIDGWFRSGDLGYQDPDDEMRLYLVGRAKELIITGGYNVYPKEVENVIMDHPAVKESAVVGLPDDDFGERVVGVVELKEGQQAPLPHEIINFCKERLAGYKCPKEIIYMETLPRNTMGKIQKTRIIEKIDNRAQHHK